MEVTGDAGHFFIAETDLAASEARKRKAERTKHLGAPISVPGKPLAMQIRGNELWIAQSDAVVRRLDLESGEILQVYKGHAGPVTTLTLLDDFSDKSVPPILITGSWDKSIKIWDTQNKSLISSTDAHSDFVKCVFPVPELKLLISSGSDKVVRFWDLSDPRRKTPLKNIGLISAHTRPVQCVAIDVHSAYSATLFTADSMGVILIWTLECTEGSTPSCRAMQMSNLNVHRTGVNDMWYGQGQLWTASTDESVLLIDHPPLTTSSRAKSVLTLTHPIAVKALLPLGLTPIGEPLLLSAAGDAIRLYDVADPGAPELLSTTDAHWHDVTALCLWVRPATRNVEDGSSVAVIEPWIVSTSLDGSIRRWRLVDLISPPKEQLEGPRENEVSDFASATQLTAEEEAELAELMGGGD